MNKYICLLLFFTIQFLGCSSKNVNIKITYLMGPNPIPYVLTYKEKVSRSSDKDGNIHLLNIQAMTTISFTISSSKYKIAKKQSSEIEWRNDSAFYFHINNADISARVYLEEINQIAKEAPKKTVNPSPITSTPKTSVNPFPITSTPKISVNPPITSPKVAKPSVVTKNNDNFSHSFQFSNIVKIADNPALTMHIFGIKDDGEVENREILLDYPLVTKVTMLGKNTYQFNCPKNDLGNYKKLMLRFYLSGTSLNKEEFVGEQEVSLK